MSEEDVIRSWGTSKQYFDELESFMKKHEGASALVFCNETKSPMYAQYNFLPYQVWVERCKLLAALAEANKEPTP